jgi:biotin carboxyl carrier protein
VPAGVDVPKVLGSRSTQLRGAFGGHEGRALRQGDRVRAGRTHHARAGTGFGLVPPALALPLEVDGVAAMRVLPAAEYPLFTDASQRAFWSEEWKITGQSDRYGYRLAGMPLVQKAAIEMRSHGIVPGVIQVPSGGAPIVQMRDAQPSGGYPKIGTRDRGGSVAVWQAHRQPHPLHRDQLGRSGRSTRSDQPLARRSAAPDRPAAGLTQQGTNMHLDQLKQLSEWLVATDIAMLELRGPDGHIRLRHDGARVESFKDSATVITDTTGAGPSRLTVAACSVGVFLHGHPLQTTPLARPGARVRAGQPLGLLQIGALLLPVTAPKDATVIGAQVAHGATVGFATPLVELENLAEAP